MNSNLRHIEKAIKQVKKIKPDNDIEVRYVNQIKRSLLNLQRHIEDDYRKLLEDNPLPDDKGNWKEVEEYKPGQKDSEEYKKHIMDNMTKMFDIPRPDDKGKCDDCEFCTTVTEKGLNDPYCYHYGKYLKDTDGCDAFSKADRKCDEPPDDAICTREIKGKCKDCRHFKRSDNGLDNMCLKHKDHIWEDNGYCDDFIYKLLSERIADGTIGCRCDICKKTFQRKDGYAAMKGDSVRAFLCERCYDIAVNQITQLPSDTFVKTCHDCKYCENVADSDERPEYRCQCPNHFYTNINRDDTICSKFEAKYPSRKEVESKFNKCPMCDGKIIFNELKDILEAEYYHIECSDCGFSWKCSPTLEDDKLVEYINHSIDSIRNKPKEDGQ